MAAGEKRTASRSAAGVEPKGAQTRARSSRRQLPKVGRRRMRVLWALAILALSAYLYYRPISSYFETRDELASRQAQVESLRRAKEDLQLRLANSTSALSTEREARRLGYVKPGERMFVVKGIPAWRAAHDRTRRQP